MTESEEELPPPELPEYLDVPDLRSMIGLFGFIFIWSMVLMVISEYLAIQELWKITLTTLAMGAPALIWVLHNRFPVKKTFRLSFPGWYHTLLAIPLGIGITVLVDGVDRWWSLLVPPDPAYIKAMQEALTAKTPADFTLLLFAAVIVAPFVEELLFRGVLQGVLELRTGLRFAWLVTALLFCFFHLNFFQFLPLLLLSCMLGLVAWRVDSIVPAIVVHGVNNLLSVISAPHTNNELFKGYLASGQLAWHWLALAALLTLVSGWGYFRFPDTESGR